MKRAVPCRARAPTGVGAAAFRWAVRLGRGLGRSLGGGLRVGLAVLLAFDASGLHRAQAAAPLTECRVPGLPNSVRCGVVRRALDPARPDGSMIDVHFVVVPAMARRRLPDPVFLLAGGPGQSAIGVAAQTMPLFSRLNNRRDIVFVDQRGTGRSAPLMCADERRETLAEQSGTEQQIQQLMACKAALLKLPYIRSASDLGFFTTWIAMQDLDAVRAQLGAERIDLVGISYGTRAALEYMRQFPQRVRRSVLDAVAPPDMVLPASFSTDGQAALDGVLRACEHAADCASTYPKLRQDWAALLASLPKPVTAAHPLSGAPERFMLTREMVLSAVRGTLYVPAVAAALPAAISAAAAGRVEGLLGLGTLLNSRRGARPALGMHFSVTCAEDAPQLVAAADVSGVVPSGTNSSHANRFSANRFSANPSSTNPSSAEFSGANPPGANPPGADFGNESATLYRRICAEWPRGAVPPAFYQVPTRTTPTLLFSGGADPATPPRHGERIAKALGPTAQHVVVPNAGHGVLGIGCARDLLFRFIDASDDSDARTLDTGCVKTIPRPAAFVPIRLAPEGRR